MMMNLRSLNTHVPEELIVLDDRAVRYETPCGDSVMVWRKWGSGDPIVLLHGAHGSWMHWVRNIDALSQRYAVWVPDLPGMGDSASPDGEDHAAIVRPIATGLRELLPGRAVPIVGFSFGGVLAPHLAAMAPDVVSRMIVIGSGGVGTPLGDITLQRLKGLEGAEREAARKANVLAVMLHHPRNLDALALWIDEHGSAHAKLNVAPLVMPDQLIIALPRTAAPLDAIWGALDGPHPDPASQEAALRQYVPAMKFKVVPDAGHWCMYENAEAFNRALIDLLDSGRSHSARLSA